MITGRAAALLLALPSPLVAQTLGYEGALSVASGDYIFTVPTNTWTLSTGAALTTGRFTLRAAWPVNVQNTTLVTAAGPGGIPSGGSWSGAVADSGRGRGGGHGGGGGGGGEPIAPPASSVVGYQVALGDPLLHATWQAVAGLSTSVRVGVGTKVPVADTATFGTGEWDVGASASLTHFFGTAGFLGVDASYWHLGDLPDLDFADPVTVTVSYGRSLGIDWGGSLYATAGTSTIDGYQPPVLAGALVTRFGRLGAWGLGASVGFTESVAAFSLTATWSVRIGRWGR